MKKYLVLCKIWNAQLKLLPSRYYVFLYGSNLYSIQNMVEIKSGVFLETIKKAKEVCEKHIRYECEVSAFLL